MNEFDPPNCTNLKKSFWLLSILQRISFFALCSIPISKNAINCWKCVCGRICLSITSIPYSLTANLFFLENRRMQLSNKYQRRNCKCVSTIVSRIYFRKLSKPDTPCLDFSGLIASILLRIFQPPHFYYNFLFVTNSMHMQL